MKILQTNISFGAAVSPNLTFATNLGHFLDKSGEWRKWNVHLQFFSYYPSEINLLFLNIRNVNVKGRVANFSANVRYFPFAIDSTPNKEIDSDSKLKTDSGDWKSGISLGLGLYRTDQCRVGEFWNSILFLIYSPKNKSKFENFFYIETRIE